jgi:hypothetical protein
VCVQARVWREAAIGRKEVICNESKHQQAKRVTLPSVNLPIKGRIWLVHQAELDIFDPTVLQPIPMSAAIVHDQAEGTRGWAFETRMAWCPPGEGDEGGVHIVIVVVVQEDRWQSSR